MSAGTGLAWLGEGAEEAASILIQCSSASPSLTALALTPAPRAGRLAPAGQPPPQGPPLTEAHYSSVQSCSQPGFQGPAAP